MGAKKSLIERAEPQEKTFENVYDEFIISRKVQNVRPATIEFYRWNLKHLKDYLQEKEIVSIGAVRKRDIDMFILWLQEKYDNSVTINTYLRATRVFLYYAMGQEYLPVFNIKMIKQDRVIKETYTDEEIKKLIRKPDLKRCSFVEYRNWIMVQYFLETGNRLNTVVNIRVKDINIEAGMATLRTVKNRKPMYSPLGASLVKIIAEYLKEWNLKGDDSLFPDVQKKQLTRTSIQSTVARYNKSRGVKKTSIHCFRHTFAKKYVMKGGNAFKLQRLLGHSSLAITEQYISLFANDLAEDFDKFSTIDEFSVATKMSRRR